MDVAGVDAGSHHGPRGHARDQPPGPVNAFHGHLAEVEDPENALIDEDFGVVVVRQP
ncbi:hypothetical protein ACWF95_14160 [Streptomyces vinaceus]